MKLYFALFLVGGFAFGDSVSLPSGTVSCPQGNSLETVRDDLQLMQAFKTAAQSRAEKFQTSQNSNALKTFFGKWKWTDPDIQIDSEIKEVNGQVNSISLYLVDLSSSHYLRRELKFSQDIQYNDRFYLRLPNNSGCILDAGDSAQGADQSNIPAAATP